MVVADEEFASEVERMLVEDFQRCKGAPATEYSQRWFGFKVAVKGARLLAPIL